MGVVLLALPSCQRTTKHSSIAEDSVEIAVAIPLSPENAALLVGIPDGDVVADVFVEDQLVAEGIRGTIASGIRAGVRGASLGVRGAGQEGVRGGVRGVPLRQDDQVTDLVFTVNFSLLKKQARDGENTLRTRIRPNARPDISLIEVKTTIVISLATATITIEDKDIDLSSVVLPDFDLDGVSDLVETVTLGADAALDATTAPTAQQIIQTTKALESKLNEVLAQTGASAVIVPLPISLLPPPGPPERYPVGLFASTGFRANTGDLRMSATVGASPSGHAADLRFGANAVEEFAALKLR